MLDFGVMNEENPAVWRNVSLCHHLCVSLLRLCQRDIGPALAIVVSLALVSIKNFRL